MEKNIQKISIELYNCKDNSKIYSCGNNPGSFTNSEKLEEVITNHVKKRGFEDFVEINSMETSSETKKNCFAIISNVLFREIIIDEIINVINKELDKILYSALKNASRELGVQQMLRF